MYKKSSKKDPSTIGALLNSSSYAAKKTAQLSGKANAAPTDEAVPSAGHLSIVKTVLWIPIRMFFGLLDPDPLVRGPGPDTFVRGMDPQIRIRIRTKMSWIRNTDKKHQRTGPLPLC
jgi:hypothetical protein